MEYLILIPEFALGAVFALGCAKGYVKLTTGMCRSAAQLNGKVALITGGNQGIGFEAAREFSRRGASVILACRNMQAANKACEDIKSEVPNANVSAKLLDVSSLKSVRAFASEIKADGTILDILVANAGVGVDEKKITAEGLDLCLVTNHLGHFLMTMLLLDKMRRPGGRIVLVASKMHTMVKKPPDLDDMNFEKGGWDTRIYDKTKLYNILFMRELNKRIQESPLKGQVTINALHPGAVKTAIFNFRHAKMNMKSLTLQFMQMFFKTPWEGAQTTIHCAVAEELEGVSGEYFSDCKKTETSPLGADMTLAKGVWDKSVKYVGLTPEEDYLAQLKAK